MSPATTSPWTVTYAPGTWLALAGPSAVVVVPPGFAAQATDLWAVVAAAGSVEELARVLARYGVDELDQFAALFVAGDTLHSLVRGDVALTTVAGDQRPGAGTRTWSETLLGDGVRVALGLDEHPGSVRLPLLAGCALVSAVVVDQSAPLDLSEIAARAEPRPAEADPAPAEPAPDEDATEQPAPDTEDTVDDDAPARPDTEDTVVERAPEPPVVAETVYSPAQWGMTDEHHAFEGEYNSGLFWPPKALLPAQQAGVATPSEPELLDSVPPWPYAGAVRDPANANTVYSTGIASTHKPHRGQDDRVLAALCSAGHANPPSTARCWRCGSPVAQGAPTLLPPPVLAQLVASTGQYADVAGTVLIGRAPSGSSAEDAVLMPVPSVSKDISRTHVRIEVRDWAVFATDQHSTNGTVLISGAGGPALALTAGVPAELHIGDSLDLGDGVVIHVGLPR